MADFRHATLPLGMAKAALVVALAASMGNAGASFDPAAICTDVDKYTPASQMLVGKHLILGESGEWAPFAFRDSSTSTGWNGLDMELLELVAAKLQFTYEVHDVAFLEDEGWDDFIQRTMATDAATTHMMLQYWLVKPSRLDSFNILRTHVNVSPVLVARLQPGEELPLVEQLSKFMRPYSSALWASLLGMVLLSGVVDFLLERKKAGARFGESIYEYTAGALWGGWHSPRSNMSAVYQVVISFILLVSVAAYTAQLAAFLTVSAAPEESVKNMRGLIYDEKPACIASDSPMREVFTTLWPQLKMNLDYGESDILDQLAVGGSDGYGCDSALVARDLVDIGMQDARFCRLRVSASGSEPAPLAAACSRVRVCVRISILKGCRNTLSGQDWMGGE